MAVINAFTRRFPRANWAARGRPVSRRRGVCITDRPNDPSAGSCLAQQEEPIRSELIMWR